MCSVGISQAGSAAKSLVARFLSRLQSAHGSPLIMPPTRFVRCCAVRCCLLPPACACMARVVRGGVGRAGMLAACIQLRLGLCASAGDAIKQVGTPPTLPRLAVRLPRATLPGAVSVPARIAVLFCCGFVVCILSCYCNPHMYL